jgi:2-iminoacetate synthase
MSFIDAYREWSFEDVSRAVAGKNAADVRRALTRSRLDLDDFEALLSPAASPFLEEMAQRSHRATVERFGRTVQMYAPLYLSNACRNVCTYCGFSAHNRLKRKVLGDEAILSDAAVLKAHGFDHVLLVTGESGQVDVAYLEHAVRLLRPRFASISLEVQPLEEAGYERLVRAGMSAVLVYQETYDAPTYRDVHLSGPKTDMTYRLETPDRLGRAALKKIGLGALYGLADWRAESFFVGLHLRYLERTYWRTRYSISFPRLRPHAGDSAARTVFGERDLVQAVCAFRLLSPEVELSLSTRESAAFRNSAFRLGFTSMSAGSRTNPGGYSSASESLEQFAIDDARSPAEVATYLRAQGYDPVWKDWDQTYDGEGLSQRASVSQPTRGSPLQSRPT